MGIKSFFSNWIVKNILLAALLMAILIGAAQILLNVTTRHNKEIVVPDFTNMTVQEAQRIAALNDMTIEVTDSVYIKRMERGTVYRHTPGAGSHVKKGRRIMLTINAVNPKSVTMPNLVGYSMRQAKAELLSRGLSLGKLIYVNDIATNNVLSQLYNSSEVDPGKKIESESVIDLVVGLNSTDNTTYVPDITGTRYLNAVDAIHDHSLNVDRLYFDKTVKDYSDSLDAVVYRQSPEMSMTAIRMGSPVTLYLTKDKNKVPVKQEPKTSIE
ncbi:MAG: PASTA domain-containing protein [Bacteroidales bacterium]|nr:PASTA domain-containing protein [Bacteroidales bacterium]